MWKRTELLALKLRGIWFSGKKIQKSMSEGRRLRERKMRGKKEEKKREQNDKNMT